MGVTGGYPFRLPPGPLDSRLWASIQQLTTEMSERVAPVLIIGPTPRPARDAPQL